MYGCTKIVPNKYTPILLSMSISRSKYVARRLRSHITIHLPSMCSVKSMSAVVFRGCKFLIKEITRDDIHQGLPNDVGWATISHANVLCQDIQAMIELLTLG